MTQKFTKAQVTKMVGGAIHKPYQVKQVLKATGLFYKPTVKKWEIKEALQTLKKKGELKAGYHPGTVISRAEKGIAAEAEAGKGEVPKEKMTVAQLREQRKAEQEKKEKMSKMMATIYGQERAREEEKAAGGKEKAVTSALKLGKPITSALERKAGLGRPEVTTSALRQKEAPKPTEEKQKPVIDLPID